MSSVPGLEPGEELLAIAPVSFRGSAAATLSMRNTREYKVWRDAAEAAGFPTVGPDMFIGVSNYRFVVCTKTFTGRPGHVGGGIPFTRIRTIASAQHGLITSLGLVIESVVEVETMRGRRLARVVGALADALARRP